MDTKILGGGKKIPNIMSITKTDPIGFIERGTLVKKILSKPNYFIEHHLESYNYLVDKLFDQIIKDPMRQTKYNNPVPSINSLEGFIDDSGNKIKQIIPLSSETDKLAYNIQYQKIEYERPTKYTESGNEIIMEEYTPNDASYNGDSYTAKLSVRIRFRVKLVKPNAKYKLVDKTFTIPMFELPAMVGSKTCSLYNKSQSELYMLGEDTRQGGGYFIIDGKPRIIVMNEELQPNRPHITIEKKSKTKSKKKGKSEYDENQRISYMCIIRSRHKGDYNTVFQTRIPYDGIDENFYIQCHPFSKYHKIPIIIAFKILGMVTDVSIINSIIGKNVFKDNITIKEREYITRFIIPSIKRTKMQNGVKVETEEDAIRFLIARRGEQLISEDDVDINSVDSKNYIRIFLQTFIPNVIGRHEKAIHLAYVIMREYLDIIVSNNPDRFLDRDSFERKRLAMAGDMTAQLIKLGLDYETTHIRTNFPAKKITDINDIVWNIEQTVESTFSERFRKLNIIKAFRNGKWQLSGKNNRQQAIKTEVTSQLSNESYTDDLANKRRMTIQEENQSRLISARNLHPSHFGFICPLETPEGKKIGLIKNMALGAKVSVGIPEEEVFEFIMGFGSIISANSGEIPVTSFAKYVDILINHKLFAFVLPKDAAAFKDYLIWGRRHRKLNWRVGIIFDDILSQFRLNSDTGRGLYPLLIVENGDILYNANTMRDIRAGKVSIDDLQFSDKYRCIEYVDLEEAEYILCAENLDVLKKSDPELDRYTHCIIDATLMLGISAGAPAFVTANSTVRSNFATAHLKHAPSQPSSNFPNKFGPNRKIITISERQIVTTATARNVELDLFSNGQNIVMAFGSYTGYNQEDSIIMNRSSVDRGMFHANLYVDNERELGIMETVEIPDSVTVIQTRRPEKYKYLDSRGLVKVGSIVEKGDVLIAIVREEKRGGIGKSKRLVYVDSSMIYKRNSPATVVSVQTIISKNKGGIKYRITTKESRPPITGDKFSSQHGQKGTISILLDSSDMPFTKNGLVPDVIIDPPGFPKRMTIGMPIEGAALYACAKVGIRIDGTPFSDVTGNDVIDFMDKFGLEDHGYTEVYDGFTGKKINTPMYLVGSFYMRQSHLAADKIHARAMGTMMNLTRQPPRGKKHNGGTRIGEMEADSFKGHGAFKILNHLFVDYSDGMNVHICGRCGLPAVYSETDQDYYCQECTVSPIHRIRIPYTTILLQRYLMGMGVLMRFKIADKKVIGYTVSEDNKTFTERIKL